VGGSIHNEFNERGKGHLLMGDEYWKLQASTHDKFVFITAGHFHHLCLLSSAQLQLAKGDFVVFLCQQVVWV
jgi:hypothetical protein